MKLAEDGRLDIDRPLVEYIPSFRLGSPVIDFPKNDRPITVRDMMTHYSGIPGDLFNGLFTTTPNPDFNAKLLEWLSEDSATYPPGYRFSYSNTAVALLANVIEAASGKSFREYSEAFLASIGMSPASFYKDDPALLARLSKSYVEGKELPTTYINIPASGSIVASANQMGLYLRMLLGRGSIDGARVVRPENARRHAEDPERERPLRKRPLHGPLLHPLRPRDGLVRETLLAQRRHRRLPELHGTAAGSRPRRDDHRKLGGRRGNAGESGP